MIVFRPVFPASQYLPYLLPASPGLESSVLIPLSRDEDTRLGRAERAAARKGGEAQICAAQACGTQMRFATLS